MASVNHLGAGDLIAERVRQEIAGFADVLALATLNNVSEKTVRPPSCLVMYGGEDIVDAGTNGAYVRLRQRWLVVVATHHAQGRERTRNEAGMLLHELIVKLMGWQPAERFSRLSITRAPAPGYGPTLGYYPLAFTTETTVMGNTTC